ncbi:MAG: ATP-binding cassette domain-containing protein [Lachnospiraceae bacterium]|nr:ATP-binding cassette domain-containing protein [Lachnospiraceae bacterium]
MSSIVSVSDVTKVFKTKDGDFEALKGINLEVEEGDIYGIIGMSGAGKSTLVRCFNFLERPTSGRVIVEGKDLAELTEKELREQRSRIGMIFQNFNLLMQKNVLDNVCFPLTTRGVKKSEAKKRAKELLDMVGLSDKEKSYPTMLSGGQKQRVAIARALATNPRILLCDEATSALDPQTTASILALLKKINQELGITIIVITHQMNVVREICNRVGIIEEGELVENGTVEQVFTHPKSRAARKLIIGGRNELDSEWSTGVISELHEEKKIRIVFSENSSYEPVISNMIMTIGCPVNILRADTKSVNGKAKGEMILGLPQEKDAQNSIIEYLKDHNLDVEEVTGDVE